MYLQRNIKRIGLTIAAVVLFLLTLVMVNQTVQVVNLAAQVHPLFGTILLWVLLFIYAVIVGVPLVLFVRLRKPVPRPDNESGTEFDLYIRQLAERLKCHPDLEEKSLDFSNPTTHTENVRRAYEILGRRADDVIRETAGIVFISTAISQSGRLDGLTVLAAQTRMVWNIAHIYNQRPALNEMLLLYKNVALTAFLAYGLDEVLDTVEDRMAPIIAEIVVPSAASAVPGIGVAASMVASCLVEGSANAFFTLRVGIIAKRYCGALAVVERREIRRAATGEALGMLGGIVKKLGEKVVERVWKLVKSGAKSIPGKAVDTVINAGKRTADSTVSVTKGAKNVISAGWTKIKSVFK